MLLGRTIQLIYQFLNMRACTRAVSVWLQTTVFMLTDCHDRRSCQLYIRDCITENNNCIFSNRKAMKFMKFVKTFYQGCCISKLLLQFSDRCLLGHLWLFLLGIKIRINSIGYACKKKKRWSSTCQSYIQKSVKKNARNIVMTFFQFNARTNAVTLKSGVRNFVRGLPNIIH